MKVLTNNRVYVQFKDIKRLIEENYPILPSIVVKAYESGYNNLLGDEDFLRFDNELEFKFLRKLDRIKTLATMGNTKDETLQEIAADLIYKKRKIEDELNKKSKEDVLLKELINSYDNSLRILEKFWICVYSENDRDISDEAYIIENSDYKTNILRKTYKI